MLYFAYGSNMSSRRLRQRLRSASSVTCATLAGHVLRFHKRGQDRSAKCDVQQTGDQRDRVYGVVFEIQPRDKIVLDRIEGLGSGYQEKQVELQTPADGNIVATLYWATDIDPDLRPYAWYKQHVLSGAVEFGLPRDYIDSSITCIETVADQDRLRHERELAIYDPVWGAGSETASR